MRSWRIWAPGESDRVVRRFRDDVARRRRGGEQLRRRPAERVWRLALDAAAQVRELDFEHAANQRFIDRPLVGLLGFGALDRRRRLVGPTVGALHAPAQQHVGNRGLLRRGFGAPSRPDLRIAEPNLPYRQLTAPGQKAPRLHIGGRGERGGERQPRRCGGRRAQRVGRHGGDVALAADAQQPFEAVVDHCTARRERVRRIGVNRLAVDREGVGRRPSADDPGNLSQRAGGAELPRRAELERERLGGLLRVRDGGAGEECDETERDATQHPEPPLP